MMERKMTMRPLMPEATAVWLYDNTELTYQQIADFVGMHHLRIKAIADGDVAVNTLGKNPIARGFVTQKNIDEAEKDPSIPLVMLQSDLPEVKRRAKGPKYTPVAKRADKPNAIAYLVKNYPDMSDGQIIRLIGTTKNTIEKIRNRTHASMATITPKDPIQLGLCKRQELQDILDKNERAAERKAKKNKKAEKSEVKQTEEKSA